jgi:hypothetical protein
MKQWQLDATPAPGKHSRMIPADGACGYPAPYHGQVLRAIPVIGTVTERPTWGQSPQVKYWLEPEKKTMWQRFLDWMVKPCV